MQHYIQPACLFNEVIYGFIQGLCVRYVGRQSSNAWQINATAAHTVNFIAPLSEQRSKGFPDARRGTGNKGNVLHDFFVLDAVKYGKTV